jgi:hypothetical protein
LSQFEYITISVSLVLAFGVTRLLGGLPQMLRGESPYWVHTLWSVTALLNYPLFWWVFWNYRNVEEWTLGAFLLTLAYPGLCYVGATLLIPPNAADDTDWRAHFFSIRRAIFSVFAVAVAVLLGVSFTMTAPPVAGLFIGGAFIVLYAIGFSVSDPRVHGVIVSANALLVVGAFVPMVWR